MNAFSPPPPPPARREAAHGADPHLHPYSSAPRRSGEAAGGGGDIPCAMGTQPWGAQLWAGGAHSPGRGHTELGGAHTDLGGGRHTALEGHTRSSGWGEGGTQPWGGHTEPWGVRQPWQGAHTALGVTQSLGGAHSPGGAHTELWISWGGGVQTAPGGAHTALTAALLHPQGLPGPPPPSDEDFGKGPWLTMKTELGVDERDPGCFLRTYSVVMVLRKVSSAPSHPPFTPPPPP